MSEKYSSLEMKDIMDAMRDENQRLFAQLCFAQKCVHLLSKYRHCLKTFAIHCVCDDNTDHRIDINGLEDEYRRLAEEDMKTCGISRETNHSISIEFNKDVNHCHNETIVATDQLSDNSNNIIESKVNEHWNRLNADNDYKLMFLKTNNGSDDSCGQYVCNWFKCGQSFGSEICLNRHKKSIHFQVFDSYDNSSLNRQTDEEIVIKCETDFRHDVKRTESAPEVHICDWVGCEMEFPSELELKRHEHTFHRQNSVKKTSISRNTNKFLGLKPLTIYTIDDVVDPIREQKLNRTEDMPSAEDKQFRCELCDKSYTRKEGLKHHMCADHNVVDKAMKMYFCDHCDYESKNNGHMKRHILRRHTNERPYKCDLGDCHPAIKCFATSDQLKAHKRAIHHIYD